MPWPAKAVTHLLSSLSLLVLLLLERIFRSAAFWPRLQRRKAIEPITETNFHLVV